MAKTYIKPEILLITMENGTSLLSVSDPTPTGAALYDFGGNRNALGQRRTGGISAVESYSGDDEFTQGGKKGGYLWGD